MTVLGVAGEPAAGFDRLADPAQDRDAVPAFLAVPDARIAGALELLLREAFVERLQFLEADDVGLEVAEPAQQDLKPGGDSVDVVAGDPEAALIPRITHSFLRSSCFSRHGARNPRE